MFTLLPDEENKPTKSTEPNETQVEGVGLESPEDHLTNTEREELGHNDLIGNHNGHDHDRPKMQSHSQATNDPEGVEPTLKNVNEIQNRNNEDFTQVRESEVELGQFVSITMMSNLPHL